MQEKKSLKNCTETGGKYMLFRYHILSYFIWGCHGHDRRVVGFTTTCVISAYRH